MKAKRTDLAAPTVIDPAAFTFVAGVYFGSQPGEDFDALLGEWLVEKDQHDPDQKAGWYSKKPRVLEDFPPLNAQGNFPRKGTCDHCGARFDWGAVYQHTSGKHIVVGNVCADKTMDVPSRLELDVKRMKSRIAAERETARNKAAARAQAEALGCLWLYDETHTNPTLIDIARKCLAWGNITDRQLELVNNIRYGKKAQWQVDREAAEAARAAELAAAEPVPVTDARIDVEGEVLTVKEQAGYSPNPYVQVTVIKMLVKTDKGYKLWGTLPSSLGNTDGGLKGKRIRFSAKVQRSDKDDKFGFFSRPTKAQVVTA